MKFTLLLPSLFILTISKAQTQDVWDTYISNYDGKPGSTMLNMSLVNAAPVKDLMYILVTGVTFKNCMKDGFPEKKQFDSLYALEDAIVDVVNKASTNKHVGSFTHQCRRLNYFYIKDTIGLRTALAGLYQSRVPDFMPYISIKEDGGWETYLKFLYPNEETQEYMSNEKVVTQLSQAGDVLVKPRPVEHWLYFKTAADRSRFIEYAKKKLFKIVNTELVKDAPLQYQLKIARVDKVDVASITKVTTALNKEARRLGGSYDGWESAVVKN